jgi:hypothetical protein
MPTRSRRPVAEHTYADRRGVCINDALWQALLMVSEVTHTSISEELRKAAVAHVERYGLTIKDGEVILNPMLWPTPPAEICEGDR